MSTALQTIIRLETAEKQRRYPNVRANYLIRPKLLIKNSNSLTQAALRSLYLVVKDYGTFWAWFKQPAPDLITTKGDGAA